MIKRSEDWNLVYQALSANSAIKSVRNNKAEVQTVEKYSTKRFLHVLSVSLFTICYHFIRSITLFGLLHLITVPCFPPVEELWRGSRIKILTYFLNCKLLEGSGGGLP